MAEIIRDPNNGNDNQRNRQSLFQSFAKCDGRDNQRPE